MGNEEAKSPELEKPSVLYHASPNQEMTSIEPRRGGYRDPNEGPVVFATPDKVYATMFLVTSKDDWTAKGRYSEAGIPGPWHIIISDRERFEKADIGGSIYKFSPKEFSFDPHRNMGNIEWTSQKPVLPIGKPEVYPSGLQAMKDAGVQVYFVDKDTFDIIKASDDHGHDILSTLTPEA